MSIAYNQAPEAINIAFSNPEIQNIQPVSENYISPSERVQPGIKTARANLTEKNKSPNSNLITQDFRSTILRGIWGASVGCITGNSGGICEGQSYLFEVPPNVKESLSYDQNRMSRWCRARGWEVMKGATYNIGGLYLNPDYRSIKAEAQDNGEFGCYINRWRFLPIRKYRNPNQPVLIN